MVLHPVTGEPTQMKIKLLGVDSPRYRMAVKEITERYIPRIDRNPRFRLTPDEQDRDNAELLSRVTVGWHGFTENGKHLEFSRERAHDFYINAHFRWLRNQVEAWIANRSNFIPA
jgi:hypothetical protein